MFLIRENSIKVLIEGYKTCNDNLLCTVDFKDVIGDDATKDNIGKCQRYLIQSGYLKTQALYNPFQFTLTVKAIDLVEDIILREKQLES